MLYKLLLVPLICIGSLFSFNSKTFDSLNSESLPLQSKIKKESEAPSGGIINNLNAAYKIGSWNNFGNYTLNGVKDLGFINLELFYDSSIIRINALNSSGNESFKDIKFDESSIKMSFLFSSSNENIDLFNIDFDVIGGTPSTTTSLTLLANEAYSLDHSPLNIKGNQHNIHLLNDTLNQTIEYLISSKENEIRTGETFNIDIKIEDFKENLVNSGSYCLSYDPYMFDFLSFEKGKFLNSLNVIFDINSETKGQINFSYVRTSECFDTDFIHFKFNCITDCDTDTLIKFEPKSLVTKDGSTVSSNQSTLGIKAKYDKYYNLKDTTILSDLLISEEKYKVRLILSLPNEPFIGAGDFTIHFNTDLLRFESFEKLSFLSYFDFSNVNTSKADNGEILINLVHLEKPSISGEFYAINFELKDKCSNINTVINIVGNNLSDSQLIKIPNYNKNISVVTTELSHESKWQVTKEPTCTSEGLKELICDKCEKIISSEIIAAKGHTYGDWIIDKDATCTESGSKHKTCGTCGDVLTEAIKTKGHSAERVLTKKPTVSEEGVESLICKICGEIIETRNIPKINEEDDSLTLIIYASIFGGLFILIASFAIIFVKFRKH